MARDSSNQRSRMLWRRLTIHIDPFHQLINIRQAIWLSKRVKLAGNIPPLLITDQMIELPKEIRMESRASFVTVLRKPGSVFCSSHDVHVDFQTSHVTKGKTKLNVKGLKPGGRSSKREWSNCVYAGPQEPGRLSSAFWFICSCCSEFFIYFF